MKTYYVYWTPQKQMMAKVDAESAEDAYKVVVGELEDITKAHLIYEEVIEENETSYEVYEDDDAHDTVIHKGTYCNY